MPQNANLSIEERVCILDRVRQSIPADFAHWQTAWLTPDQLADRLDNLSVEVLNNSVDRFSFSLQMMKFFGMLNNGHTRFLDPLLDELPPPGFAARQLSEGWVCTTSQIAGLQVGDLLLEADESSMELWQEKLKDWTVGSPQSRSLQIADNNAVFRALLGLFLPEEFNLRIEKQDGRQVLLTIDRRKILPCKVSLSPWATWQAESVALLRLPSFFQPEFEQAALGLLGQYRSAKALIIDVRGNSGGNTPNQLMRALLNCPWRGWTEKASGSAGSGYILAEAPHHEPDPQAYQGKIILLIDRATWSAAEDFIMPFKESQRAVLIGEASGGSSGQPFFQQFDNGILFSIGTRRLYLPDGNEFEGVGIAPDIPVESRREDLYMGSDRVLETGISTAG